jgi:hypothetical protein
MWHHLLGKSGQGTPSLPAAHCTRRTQGSSQACATQQHSSGKPLGYRNRALRGITCWASLGPARPPSPPHIAQDGHGAAARLAPRSNTPLGGCHLATEIQRHAASLAGQVWAGHALPPRPTLHLTDTGQQPGLRHAATLPWGEATGQQESSATRHHLLGKSGQGTHSLPAPHCTRRTRSSSQACATQQHSPGGKPLGNRNRVPRGITCWASLGPARPPSPPHIALDGHRAAARLAPRSSTPQGGQWAAALKHHVASLAGQVWAGHALPPRPTLH